jgi:hypothetical protein
MTNEVDEMSDGSRGYPFSYHLLMTCNIAGVDYEFSKEFRSPTQHRAGDAMHIGELEEVQIKSVTWYIDDPGRAFMETEDLRLGGEPASWAELLEYFDSVTPELPG